MNPRRSSRARATQPPPPSTAMRHTNSSSSQNSLNRVDRATRSNNKISPPGRSATRRSQSIDDADAVSKNDLPHTRQRQRGRDDVENNDPPLTGDEYDEEEGDEEEITRCICGHQDYPGLPPTSRDLADRSSLKVGAKDEPAQNGPAPESDLLAEDPGSLFIQCDLCKVWQHGGCVGIMEEALSPDEYFCERCRKELHKIIVGAHGQKSSHYLPVAGSTSPSSTSSGGSSKNGKGKKARDREHALSTKRRSTMNSRDAAYDEEELLRRALEESKEDTKSLTDETGSRRGKRSRSDSVTNKQATKRQRTGSPSPSFVSKQSRTISQTPSDEETKSKASVNGNQKKTRATTARYQRQKESEVAEPEPEKENNSEAINRRKSRSERRKGEVELEPPETASPAKANSNPPAAPSNPDTPNTTQQATTTTKQPRKTGRPPARRGRLGRNQYTRDRDAVNGNGLDGDQGNHKSPRRGQSRDGGNGDSPTGQGANGVYTNGGESGRPSKPRYMNPNRTTMNDMRRRVAGILEFISRMQVEMAASGEQATPPSGADTGGPASKEGSSSGAATTNTSEVAATLAKVNAEVQSMTAANNNSDQASSTAGDSTQDNGRPKQKEFKDMTSVEMMDVLTRNLLKWQQEFGKYGDK